MIHRFIRSHHPIRFIKRIYYRARYGWAPEDTWDMDRWFLKVVPQMLHYFAQHTHGWPESEQFPTYESWQKYIHNIAYMLENASYEAREAKEVYGSADLSDREFARLWIEEDRKLAEEQQVILEDAFEMLSKVFFHLWD